MKFAPPHKKKTLTLPPFLSLSYFGSKNGFQRFILWHMCFHVNFVKFLRAPFFTQHLQWMLPNSWMKRLLDFLLDIH